MEAALLVDFGSTYTKVTLVDLRAEQLLGTARAFTTIETDITEGLLLACQDLQHKVGFDPFKAQYKLASSSAAGGLKLVAVGLVRELTVEAAKRAALGAGARVLETFSNQLTATELQQLMALKPDLLLLAGGTDGGNRNVIVQNAHLLADAGLQVPVVVAGNKVAVQEVRAILAAGGIDCRVTENVMPELNTLNVEPARATIRTIFLEKIVEAKGLKKVAQLLDGILMPTPSAVLNAAMLLAQGTAQEPGIGELVLIDIGGATTDVHSVALGEPSRAGVQLRGLPEPFAKRTVEGDLGMRYSVQALLESAEQARLPNYIEPQAVGQFECYIQRIKEQPESLPSSIAEGQYEEELAKVAAEIAMERHAGTLEVVYTPFGASYLQYGKDLTPIPNLLGTGGVIVNHQNPAKILAAACFKQTNPNSLRPQQPKLLVDKDYILAAMGLLAEIAPTTALRLAKQGLKAI